MASTIVAPEVESPIEQEPLIEQERVIEQEPLRVTEPDPIGWKQRVRDLLAAIFKGHEEYLGWTPD